MFPLRVRYESFVHDEHSEWLYDKEFTPVMLFESLFGNNFERIQEETERYGRRKDANYSLSIAEVKCCIAVLLVLQFTSEALYVLGR